MASISETDHELKFIQQLGKWRANQFCPGRTEKTRRELLSNYLNACLQRDDWGEIDRKLVIEFVRSELKSCRG
jgi:hypothetical protein